ncbi:MAG TPA: CerR family C-terminal domain-containing protein [Bryobacteraceae bacterium]|nr:CerR family C-terminal domain-containing protein [Bryobacteraceae bacterium]
MASQATPLLAEGTRHKLLDAAGQVFAEHGFKAATVREICARAHANVALVNYHFGDKEKLYEAVLKLSFGSTEPEVRALHSGLPPADAFRQGVLAIIRRILRPGRPAWHFRVLTHEMAQPTPAFSKVIDETMRPIYERVCALIGALLDLPVDHEKTRLCAHSVIAQIVHYAHGKQVNAKIWPELELTPERIEQIGNHIADFSLAYLTAAPANRKTVKKRTIRRNK